MDSNYSAGFGGALRSREPSPNPHGTRQDEEQLRLSANSNASLRASQLAGLEGKVSHGANQDTGAAELVGAPVWVQRLRLVVMVVFCLELGMLLAVLPWTRIWLENAIFAAHPAFQNFAREDFVRGAISGLGLVDIWIGIAEAVNYREVKNRK